MSPGENKYPSSSTRHASAARRLRVAGASVAEVVVDDATAVFCRRNRYVCAKSVGADFQLLDYESTSEH